MNIFTFRDTLPCNLTSFGFMRALLTYILYTIDKKKNNNNNLIQQERLRVLCVFTWFYVFISKSVHRVIVVPMVSRHRANGGKSVSISVNKLFVYRAENHRSHIARSTQYPFYVGYVETPTNVQIYFGKTDFVRYRLPPPLSTEPLMDSYLPVRNGQFNIHGRAFGQQ